MQQALYWIIIILQTCLTGAYTSGLVHMSLYEFSSVFAELVIAEAILVAGE